MDAIWLACSGGRVEGASSARQQMLLRASVEDLF
jgi:hypothetical protein